MLRRLLAALFAFGVTATDPRDAPAADDAPGDDRPRGSQLAAGLPAPDTLAPLAGPFGQWVGVVSLASLPGPSAFEPALSHALEECRDRGDLKVLVVPGPCAPGHVRRACERHGFMFSRVRHAPDATVLEFYTDLYYRPRPHGHRGFHGHGPAGA